ncbi:MAG: ParB/RepB/Spo0J family partition protein, partial [Planctomycetota bacterium]
MTHKLFPLSKIKPNPYRQMDRYPISEEKIEALIGSMGRTGYWDNVVGRVQNGHVELAYGHHRMIAFERKFGKRVKMNIIVRDLTEDDMLRIMADENADEYGTSATVEQETIRAVVDAYAAGKIELEAPAVGKKGSKSVRYAPSFRVGHLFNDDKKMAKPYNAESIARFLGWMTPGGQVSPRVRN